MNATFILLWLVGAGLLLFPLLHTLKHSSAEAERMFTLVRTGRMDQRKVSTVNHLARRSVGLLRSARKLCRLESEGRRSKQMQAAGLRGSSAEEIFFAAQLSGAQRGVLHERESYRYNHGSDLRFLVSQIVAYA